MSFEVEEPSLGGPSPPPEEESFGAASPLPIAVEDPEPRSPREQPTREVEMSSEVEEEPSLGGPSPPPEDESFGAASPVAIAVEAEEEPSLGGPSPPPEEESFGAASPGGAAAAEGPEPRSPSARPAREVFGVSSPVVSEFCRQPSRNPDRDVACETPPGGADASGVDDDDADEQFTVGEKSIASDPSNSWKLTPLPALDMEAARRVMASDNAAEEEEEEEEEEGSALAAAAAASGSGAAPEAGTGEEKEDRAGAGGDAGSSSKPSSRAGSDAGAAAAAAAAAGAERGAGAQPRCERPAPEVFGVASPVVSEFCRQPSRNPDRNVVRETPGGADVVAFDDDADADEQFAVGERSFASDPSNSMRLTPLPALDLEGCSSRPASRAGSKADAAAAAAAAADAEEGTEGADEWPGVFGVASPVVGEFCRQPSRNPHRDVAREPSGAEEDETDEQFRVGSKSITSDPSSSLRLSPLPALDVHGCSSKPASRAGSNNAAAAGGAAAAAAAVGPEAEPRSEWPAAGVFDVASPVVGEFCRQPSRNPDRNVVCETPGSADADAFGLDNDADEQQFVVGSKSITSDPSNSLKLTPLPVLDMEVAREKDKGASEPAGAPLADIEEEAEAEAEGEGCAAGGRSVPGSLAVEGKKELFGASSPIVGEFCRQPSRSPDRGLGSEAAGAVDASFDLDEDADADERFTVGSKSISSDPSNSLKLTPLPALEVDGTGGVQSSLTEPPPGSSSPWLPAALRGPSLDSDGAAAEGGPQPVGGELREADRHLAPLLEAEAASVEESPSRPTSPGQPPSPPAGERGRSGGLSPPHGEQRDRRASMQSLISNRSAFEVSDSEDDEEGQLFSIEEEQTRPPSSQADEDEEGPGSQGGSLPASLQRPPPQRRQGPPGPAAASTHSMQLQASRVGSVPPPLPHSGASSEILSGQYFPTQRMLTFKQTASGRRLACSNQTLKQAAALQSTNQRSGKEEAIDFMEQMKAEEQSEFVDSIHKQKSLEDPSTCSPCSLHFVQLSACASQRDADEPATCTVT